MTTFFLGQQERSVHVVITTQTQKRKAPSKREIVIVVVTDHLMTWRALTVSARRTPATQGATRRPPWQRHIPDWLTTSNAKPVRRVSGGVVPLDETVPWPNAQGRTLSRMTTCLQLPSPRRARLRGPTNSGYRRSFRLRAAVRTTPSHSAAPWCGEPSQCMAHTSVVSIASWHPPWRGKPSTTTSNRLLSVASTGKSTSRMKVLTATRPLASLQILACPLASCTVVAKDVNGAATPATADGKREGQPKPPKKDNTEQMRLDRGEAVRGRHSQSDTSSRSSLGTDECPIPV